MSTATIDYAPTVAPQSTEQRRHRLALPFGRRVFSVDPGHSLSPFLAHGQRWTHIGSGLALFPRSRGRDRRLRARTDEEESKFVAALGTRRNLRALPVRHAPAIEPIAELTDSWIHAGFIQYILLHDIRSKVTTPASRGPVRSPWERYWSSLRTGQRARFIRWFPWSSNSSIWCHCL